MHNRNLKVRICAIVAIVLLVGLTAPVGAAPVTAGDGAGSLWDLVLRTWQTTIDSIFAASGSDDVQGPITDPNGNDYTQGPITDPNGSAYTQGPITDPNGNDYTQGPITDPNG